MERKEILQLAGAALIGLAAGSAGTYFVLRQRLANRVHELEKVFAAAIEETREHYVTLNKTEYATPEDAVRALIGDEEPESPVSPALAKKVIREAKDRTDYNAISTQYQGTNTPPVTVTSSVFDRKNVLPPRGPNGQFIKREVGDEPDPEPYLIDEETFLQNDTEYDQEEVTYHHVDNTVVDAQGETVENEILGNVNLNMLKTDVENHPDDGHVMYIRNEKLTMEYCVVVSDEPVSALYGLSQEG